MLRPSLLFLLSFGILNTGCGGGSSSSSATQTPTELNNKDTELTSSAQCQPAISLYQLSEDATVLGDGSPESCNEETLRSAAEQGGEIRFNCGSSPHTIALTQTIHLPTDRDSIIDGQGLITLDAQNSVRHFSFEHPDWMNNPNKLVLQGLTLTKGQAPHGEYFAQDPANPKCAYGYKEGSGGAVFIRNGHLHIINSKFINNNAAQLGPDVGGGAIYAVGVPEVIISASQFTGNQASNGGAIGILFAGRAEIYNSQFENNRALGVGTNYVEAACPTFNHAQQGGAGGNSGALYFDGMNDDDSVFTICDSRFINNRANELGGALFRTPNVAIRNMLIENCVFDGNTARMGGVSFIKDNNLTVKASSFINNKAGVDVEGNSRFALFGGLWLNSSTLVLENSTFYNNSPSALNVEGKAEIKNSSFVESTIKGELNISNSVFLNSPCQASYSGQNNVQWPQDDACSSNISFEDPQLSQIDSNKALPVFIPTQASPLLNAGSDCLEQDQLGNKRNTSNCTIGAVEYIE